MWVLEGLDGIQKVKMDLERDAFSITYLPSRLDLKAIQARIRLLGFRPVVQTEPPPAETREIETGKALPGPVRAALHLATKEDRLLIIDFFAEWCGPCVTLEKEVLVDARVKSMLQRFRLLKIDTDRDTESARWFGVVALPTLLVLDTEGNEIYRHEGAIEAPELAKTLAEVSLKEKSVPSEKK